MSAHSNPRIYTFKVDGSIAKGAAVKAGSDRGHVAIGAANTDKAFGIAQVEAVASGDYIEVALQGGGAKALLGETVVAGNYLVSGTDGRLVLPNAAGDKVVAQAMEGGAANDLIAVEVIQCVAAASE